MANTEDSDPGITEKNPYPPSYNEIYHISDDEGIQQQRLGTSGPSCSYGTSPRDKYKEDAVGSNEGNHDNEAEPATKKSLSQVFYEFTQNSSFHGARQITEPQPFMLRRMVWFLVFLGSSVLLVLQMGLSIQYYLSWPVSVDVKIIYNDSIQFPAVTLCNKNAFKTSKAFSKGYYFLLHDLYKDAKRTANFSQYQEAGNTAMTTIYEETGHIMQDLVLGCEWEGSPCGQADFLQQLTDYGLCYTFNSGAHGTPLKMASTTGSGGGLRLQLNIEQYEYMRGPNEGAGLKVLIHNYNEIPLVKDHAVAVPPGSHAFMSVKTTEVHNLEPKHGKCNDSVTLAYFEDYTVASCQASCKLDFVVERCRCKDIYMPGPAPVCTLLQYQDCLVETLETYTQMKQVCDCPVPCDSLLFEPIVSYAATSNFDILALLRKNDTKSLAERYLNAREINQKVNQAIVQDDHELIQAFVASVEELNVVVGDIKQSLETIKMLLTLQHDVMQQRMNFHLEQGLKKVKFVLEDNILRQWKSYFEKNFDHLLFDYKGLPLLLKQSIQDANGTVSFDNRDHRILVILPVQAALWRRLDISTSTSDYIRRIEKTFREDDETLIVIAASFNYHYDPLYKSADLMATRMNFLGKEEYDKQYDDLVYSVREVRSGLYDLLSVIDDFTENSTFDAELYESGQRKFVNTVENFHDRLYRYDKQIVELPTAVIDETILNFKLDNKSQFDIFSNILRKIDTINASMMTSSKEYWEHAQKLTELSMRYLSNEDNLTKTEVADAVNSQEVKESFYALHLFFNDVQLYLRSLRNELQALKISYDNAWRSMWSCPYTKPFYKKLSQDIKLFDREPGLQLTGRYHDDYKYDFPELWFQLLQDWFTSREDVNRLSILELRRATNGDFEDDPLEYFLNQTEHDFQDLLGRIDDAYQKADLDEPFLIAFDKYKAALEDFLEGSVVNSKFYRENFMRLDIFLQELRYEEIRQQKAYDVIKLLGDIGGSMGLFLGASVLSIIEFFDMFVHHGVQFLYAKKAKKKKAPSPTQPSHRQKSE